MIRRPCRLLFGLTALVIAGSTATQNDLTGKVDLHGRRYGARVSAFRGGLDIRQIPYRSVKEAIPHPAEGIKEVGIKLD